MEAIEMRKSSTTTPMIRRAVQPSKRLCKSLFGPVDHDEIKSELDHELAKDLSEKSKEWCFDFGEGTPILGGSLAWEKVEERSVERPMVTPLTIINEDRRVPELHAEKDEPEIDVFLAPSDAKTVSSISTRSSTAAKLASTVTEKRHEPVVDRKRKRPCKTITDFMKQKKKRRVSHSSLEKNSQTDLSPNVRCVQDDLVLRNSAKKVRVSES